MTVSATDTPRMPRGVRLHFDKVRDAWVLLAPERALKLDAVGHAILSEIDGERSLGAIAGELSQKFNAPVEEIERDAGEFVSALLDRRILELVR